MGRRHTGEPPATPVVATTRRYTTVFTDGSSTGSVGPGGWAWAVPDGPEASGGAEQTTNQRMELVAAMEAVAALPGLLLVVSDSAYVVNCFQQGWWQGWQRRGWRTAAGAPVANRDLWEPFVAAVQARGGQVRFAWIKGHSGHPENDRVDALARAARLAITTVGTGASPVAQ